jgi:hypothetical protein
LNSELEAIKNAWDKTTGGGRDDAGTRALCDTYVATHPEQFADYRGMKIEDCVRAVSVFRAAGLDEAQWRAEVWLLHRFEPQHIGGPMRAQIRLPSTGAS